MITADGDDIQQQDSTGPRDIKTLSDRTGFKNRAFRRIGLCIYSHPDVTT